MGISAHLLASGSGWRVSDIVCTAGPLDRPFEEQHDAACIAAVTQGMFQYRSTQGSAVLAPGAVLLGNDRQCFECGHEHGTGDRCLSFHFAPEFLEAIVAAEPRARRVVFTVPRLPPLAALIPLIAAAEAARDIGDAAELDELALRLAGAVLVALGEPVRAAPALRRRDEQRVAAALHRIETKAHEPLLLADLAREAATSPYHFLRIFQQVVGMTPHQFVLRTRLHRAAVRLRRSDDGISAIAFDAGFNDLSTFNRRFRRVMGMSPSAYRARGGGAGRS
jgi:AraC-like DNA-binding protein